ncbi:MAG: McrB family protein [Treponema sp.]
MIELLKAKHNIILHGAPGTGKTFTAQQIASQMIFNRAYENLTDVEKAQIGFVQFHPSYDYTDFVEGLRPKKEAGQKEIGFERKNGVFKDFCERAILAKNEAESLQNEEKEKPKFVFIIDEINRGDISKIFGELFFSIEPSYRGVKGKVSTQYQNLIEEGVFKDGFYVPENVYIIGTMNDIDRSVESMDFAMRRRFVFCEITAKDSAKAMGIDYTDESPMKRLNDAIEKEFGRDYQIGGAYFKEYKDKLNDEKALKELWELSLKGLLKEYLRGKRNVKLEDFEDIFYGNNKNSGQ